MLKLFSVPIYSKQLNLNVDEMIKYCLFIKRKTKGIKRSNQGGWHSPILQGNHPPLNYLFNEILKAANDYREVISYKYPLQIDIAWININGYKDYNIQHAHPNSVLSGAYYLTSNNSNIVFINPSCDVMDYQWERDTIKEYNEYNSKNWTLNPPANNLLLFPGWLNHRVDPNLNKKNRISISFNLIKGIHPSNGL